jgi:hypothetical protein
VPPHLPYGFPLYAPPPPSPPTTRVHHPPLLPVLTCPPPTLTCCPACTSPGSIDLGDLSRLVDAAASLTSADDVTLQDILETLDVPERYEGKRVGCRGQHILRHMERRREQQQQQQQQVDSVSLLSSPFVTPQGQPAVNPSIPTGVHHKPVSLSLVTPAGPRRCWSC